MDRNRGHDSTFLAAPLSRDGSTAIPSGPFAPVSGPKTSARPGAQKSNYPCNLLINLSINISHQENGRFLGSIGQIFAKYSESARILVDSGQKTAYFRPILPEVLKKQPKIFLLRNILINKLKNFDDTKKRRFLIAIEGQSLDHGATFMKPYIDKA